MTQTLRADGSCWRSLSKVRLLVQSWFKWRSNRRDSVTLTHRNIYILPTRAGWMLTLTLLVLLLASINYQLNLGYVLTFLIAGSALVSMYVCHGNLQGITLHFREPRAVFSGDSALFDLQVSNPSNLARYALKLAVSKSNDWVWTNIRSHATTAVHLQFPASARGVLSIPTLTAETRFPLGIFRAWTVWNPSAELVVYPAPETSPPPLPNGEPCTGGNAELRRQASEEFDGVRAYRLSDPLKLIVWKKAAGGGPLVSRTAQGNQYAELWLNFEDAERSLGSGSLPAAKELALSRLCAWVLEAESKGLHYGLRLGADVAEPDRGAAHQEKCLRALATA
jgi:uncharacterized protein (DUF58 family)